MVFTFQHIHFEGPPISYLRFCKFNNNPIDSPVRWEYLFMARFQVDFAILFACSTGIHRGDLISGEIGDFCGGSVFWPDAQFGDLIESTGETERGKF